MLQAFSLVAVIVLTFATDVAAASGKGDKNPLAGNWTGTIESLNPGGALGTDGSQFGPPRVLSFRITKSGSVVDFTTTVGTSCRGPDGPPNPVVEATIAPPPLNLSKPSASFPRGKRFEFVGQGSSPAGSIELVGKADINRGTGAFRGRMLGYATISNISVGTFSCESLDRRFAGWVATRAGRR